MLDCVPSEQNIMHKILMPETLVELLLSTFPLYKEDHFTNHLKLITLVHPVSIPCLATDSVKTIQKLSLQFIFFYTVSSNSLLCL